MSKEPEPNNLTSPPPRRRGCLGKFVLYAVVAAAVLLLLSGPLFRWGATIALKKAVTAQGLTGDFTVGGSPFRGVSLTGIGLAGGPVLRGIDTSHISVRYSLWDLVRGKGLAALEEIRLEEASIHLVLPDEKTGGGEPDKEPDAPVEPARESPLWDLLGTRVSIVNTTVHVEQGKSSWRIENLSLELPEEGEGSLQIGRLELQGTAPRENISTTVTVTPSSLALGSTVLADPIRIDSLTLQKPSRVNAVTTIAGGTLELVYGDGGTLKADLTRGSVDLPPLFRMAGSEFLDAGKLTALGLGFSGTPTRPDTWDLDASLHLTGLRKRGLQIDTVSLDATTSGNPGARLVAARADATLELDLTAPLAGTTDLAALRSIPADAKILLDIPELTRVLPAGATPLTGGIRGAGDLRLQDGQVARGTLTLSPYSLAFRGAPIRGEGIGVRVETPNAATVTADITLDDMATLTVSAEADPVTLGYRDGVARLEIFGALDRDGLPEVAADGHITWSGTGEIRGQKHRGNFAIALADIISGGGDPFGVTADGRYNETSLAIPAVSVTADPVILDGSLSWVDNVLEIPGLAIRDSGRTLMEGRLRVPLGLGIEKSAAGFFGQQGEAELLLTNQQLPLGTIASLFGKTFPLEGTITTDINVTGSLRDLSGTGSLKVAGLRLPEKDDIPPASLALEMAVGDGHLRADGSFTHPQTEPFRISASLPFQPERWSTGERAPATEPVNLTIRMAESPLAPLKDYLPGVKEIHGTTSVDLTVSGPLAEPLFSGNAGIVVSDLLWKNPEAPSLRDLDGRLRLDGRTLVIEKFSALVAGGTIAIGGEITFPAGLGPQVDLNALGGEVLVYRNEDLNMRTDADLKLSGPWETASLSGEIALTSCRYVKEIDLLPLKRLALPHSSSLPKVGRATSAAPSFDPSSIRVPAAPFKDWPVALQLHTRDPFLILGNVAQGKIECDVSLGGTLGAPAPDGRVYIPEGRLTLPFSKIDIARAEVVFTPATGFDGALEIKAVSQSGDTSVNLYAYNSLSAPKLTLTSTPPLPHEDIWTLLATGSTRQELAGADGTEAATKAASLLFKKIYPGGGSTNRGEPTLFDKLSERSEVKAGGVDPETGERTFGGKIKLWDPVFFEGSAGFGGYYRGLFKYRFNQR